MEFHKGCKIKSFLLNLQIFGFITTLQSCLNLTSELQCSSLYQLLDHNISFCLSV